MNANGAMDLEALHIVPKSDGYRFTVDVWCDNEAERPPQTHSLSEPISS